MNRFEPDLILISDSLELDIQKAIEQIRVLTYNIRPVIIVLSKSNHIQDKIDYLKLHRVSGVPVLSSLNISAIGSTT